MLLWKVSINIIQISQRNLLKQEIQSEIVSRVLPCAN